LVPVLVPTKPRTLDYTRIRGKMSVCMKSMSCYVLANCPEGRCSAHLHHFGGVWDHGGGHTSGLETAHLWSCTHGDGSRTFSRTFSPLLRCLLHKRTFSNRAIAPFLSPHSALSRSGSKVGWCFDEQPFLALRLFQTNCWRSRSDASHAHMRGRGRGTHQRCASLIFLLHVFVAC
jgi:hypothetical protein